SLRRRSLRSLMSMSVMSEHLRKLTGPVVTENLDRVALTPGVPRPDDEGGHVDLVGELAGRERPVGCQAVQGPLKHEPRVSGTVELSGLERLPKPLDLLEIRDLEELVRRVAGHRRRRTDDG